VKLAALPAWVDGRRQITKQRGIEDATGEGRVQLGRIDADQTGLESSLDELARQAIGRLSPEWEHPLKAERLETLLAISAYVLEEEIAVGDASNGRIARSHVGQRALDGGIVRGVGRLRLEDDLVDR
jgi:hypothetical protein